MDSFAGRCRIVAFFVLLGSATLAGSVGGQEAAKQEAEHCFLWKVSSKTTTLFLLGSMHVGRADFFPLPKEIEDAFASSKTLVVEVDTSGLDQAKLQKLIFEKGLYPAGEKLSKNVSKKTMSLLEKYCAKKKLEVADFESIRPWMLALLLSVEELKALGLTEDKGIDKHFEAKANAKATKKRVIELETADAQIELFAGLAPELQEQTLAKLLVESGDLKKQMEVMIVTWKTGDGKAMAKALTDSVKDHPEFKPLMVKMFDDRNVKMTDKIVSLLREKESCFVMVGAGHLVGEKGIVKLLADKGYQVEQVKRAAAKK